jgi:hypothetical protein
LVLGIGKNCGLIHRTSLQFLPVLILHFSLTFPLHIPSRLCHIWTSLYIPSRLCHIWTSLYIPSRLCHIWTSLHIPSRYVTSGLPCIYRLVMSHLDFPAYTVSLCHIWTSLHIPSQLCLLGRCWALGTNSHSSLTA